MLESLLTVSIFSKDLKQSAAETSETTTPRRPYAYFYQVYSHRIVRENFYDESRLIRPSRRTSSCSLVCYFKRHSIVRCTETRRVKINERRMSVLLNFRQKKGPTRTKVRPRLNPNLPRTPKGPPSVYGINTSKKVKEINFETAQNVRTTRNTRS